MKYDCVAFDFDGTLADTIPWFESVMDQIADRYGFRRVAPADRDRLRSCDSRKILQHLNIPFWKMPAIMRHTRELMEAVSPNVRLFDEVPAVLHRLRAAGVTLAVVSSNSSENVRRVLGPELSELIAHYECGAGIFGKSAKLRRLLRTTGVARQRMILIGDELRDMDAARESGICSGAVAWGYNKIEVLRDKQPDEVFSRVGEVALRIAPAAG